MRIQNGKILIKEIVAIKMSIIRFKCFEYNVSKFKFTSIKGTPTSWLVRANPVTTSYMSGSIFIETGCPLTFMMVSIIRSGDGLSSAIMTSSI